MRASDDQQIAPADRYRGHLAHGGHFVLVLEVVHEDSRADHVVGAVDAEDALMPADRYSDQLRESVRQDQQTLGRLPQRDQTLAWTELDLPSVFADRFQRRGTETG